jgi:hypothetical protein
MISDSGAILWTCFFRAQLVKLDTLKIRTAFPMPRSWELGAAVYRSSQPVIGGGHEDNVWRGKLQCGEFSYFLDRKDTTVGDVCECNAMF